MIKGYRQIAAIMQCSLKLLTAQQKLLPIRKIALTNVVRYNSSFFSKSWRNQQYAITERIKKCNTSNEIKAIIDKSGPQLNIVHLTAILDRIEEQNMLKIEKIVDFVIYKLKNYRDYLLVITPENVRTVCNIICYLGNLKNTELNYIFTQINYGLLLSHKNTIETAMLITGLIRLGIFKEIFGIKHENSKRELLLEDIVTADYSRNQILSIWYAYMSEISKENETLNNYMNELIGRTQIGDIINLKIYTYAVICYVRCSHTFKNNTNGYLFQLIKEEIPLKSKVVLLPHQFSLLLHNVKKLMRKRTQLETEQNAVKTSIVFPEQFQLLLERQFEVICRRHNITLRNIANIFKEFNESFSIRECFIQAAITKIIAILQQEINFALKAEKYELDYKIDLLSLSSLCWKLSQAFDKNLQMKHSTQNKALFTKFAHNLVSYLKLLKSKQLISRFANKQLIMFYSGLSLLKHPLKLELDDQFQQLSVNLVAEEGRNFTIKEILFLHSYFRTMKIFRTDFCDFVKEKLQKLSNTSDFEKTAKAKSMLQKKCIMNIGSKCLNCFPNVPKPEEAVPTSN